MKLPNWTNTRTYPTTFEFFGESSVDVHSPVTDAVWKQQASDHWHRIGIRNTRSLLDQ